MPSILRPKPRWLSLAVLIAILVLGWGVYRQLAGGTDRRVVVAADDSALVFLDGHPSGKVRSWTWPAVLATNGDDRRVLVAVEARNEAASGGLLLAAVLGSPSDPDKVLPAAPLCSTQLEPGWFHVEFDDSGWSPPVPIGRFGAPPWGEVAGFELGHARWFWTDTPVPARQTIYCRWWLPPSDQWPALHMDPGIAFEGESGASETAAARDPAIPGGTAGSIQQGMLSGRTGSRASVWITADNNVRLFVDGHPAGQGIQWEYPAQAALPANKARVLVAATATNTVGPGGLLGAAQFRGPDGRVQRIPATWRCVDQAPPGWFSPELDDRQWPPAEIVATYGQPPWHERETLQMMEFSQWVWTRMPVPEGDTVYCRWWLTNPLAQETSTEPDGPAPRPETPEPATAIVAVDDSATIFVGGVPAARIGNWQGPATFPVPTDRPRVLVAVSATNHGGPGGVAGVLLRSGADGETAVPADWHCSTVTRSDWFLPESEVDAIWKPAAAIAPYGEGAWGDVLGPRLNGATWVWAESPVPERQTVYCHWWIENPRPEPTSTPPEPTPDGAVPSPPPEPQPSPDPPAALRRDDPSASMDRPADDSLPTPATVVPEQAPDSGLASPPPPPAQATETLPSIRDEARTEPPTAVPAPADSFTAPAAAGAGMRYQP